MTTDFKVGLMTHAQEKPINVQLEFTITFHLWRGELVIQKMCISIADNYVTNIIPVRTLSDAAQQLTGKIYVASWTAARHITVKMTVNSSVELLARSEFCQPGTCVPTTCAGPTQTPVSISKLHAKNSRSL